MNFSSRFLGRMADAYGKLPSMGDTMRAGQEQFERFRSQASLPLAVRQGFANLATSIQGVITAHLEPTGEMPAARAVHTAGIRSSRPADPRVAQIRGRGLDNPSA